MCRDIFICEEVSWLRLSDCDWDAMLELDSMRCRIGGSNNAKMKYHYSVRSNLSVVSLHDLQWNKGRKQEVPQQSPHSSKATFTLDIDHWISVTFRRVSIYAFIFIILIHSCVLCRGLMCVVVLPPCWQHNRQLAYLIYYIILYFFIFIGDMFVCVIFSCIGMQG